MPVAPVRPPVLRGRVFRGTWAVAAGVLTKDQLRSSAWRRLRRDVYADAALPVDHRLLARGVGLVMPRSAAFGGLTAAVLWDAPELATAEDPVEVVVPPGTRWTPGPGVVVRSAPLEGDVVRSGSWMRWTGRVRTAVDLVRRDGSDEAVVLLDRLVCARVVDLDAVRAAVGALPRCRGSAHARRAACLADGLAESPQETRSGSCCTARDCPSRWLSTRSGATAGSWRGSTSPGPDAGSRWSTTAPGTEHRTSCPGTAAG